MANEKVVRRQRKRQSVQKLITKGVARVIAARVIADVVDYLWSAWENRKEHGEHEEK